MDIGSRLRVAREAIGYTLKKAASESGIGESSISEFENAKREPKFSQLSKLADVYRKSVEFFLTDEMPGAALPLWRDPASSEEERKKTEAEFLELCEQYHKLEVLTNEVKRIDLPRPNVSRAEDFDYNQAELFAKRIQEGFLLGDIPIKSLKQILEETYYVKIFYLDFSGSAISTVSGKFGPAILLNGKNKQWRRSYDLAHELFHILTWNTFRTRNSGEFIPNNKEESLANAFASRLLLPEEAIRDRVKSGRNAEGQISLDQLDDIARKFDVSLIALIYRVAHIFKLNQEETEKCRNAAEKYIKFLKPRPSYEPNMLPERYRDLAQRALREGKLSLMQFAKYMSISYKKAQEYLMHEEDFTDEEISIPVA